MAEDNKPHDTPYPDYPPVKKSDRSDKARRAIRGDLQKLDNRFEFEVRLRNRLPPPPPGDFTMTVRVKFSSTGFDEASARLRKLIDANEMVVRLFERAVLQSVVVNVRGRFLANMTKALEMKVLEQDGRRVAVSPRERMNDVNLQKRMADAIGRLNQAQADGADDDTVAALRERTMKLGDKLRDSMGQDPRGKAVGHRLSQLAGNNFRRMMLRLLMLIVDAQFVKGERSGSGVTIGVAPMFWLDQLETPSATMALSGMRTTSKYRSFWRHLEFGTGARRSAAKDKLNPGARPPGTWWYGRKQKASLLLEGTLPMNFLTDAAGKMYAEDMTALAKALTKALDDILSVKA